MDIEAETIRFSIFFRIWNILSRHCFSCFKKLCDTVFYCFQKGEDLARPRRSPTAGDL